MMKLTILAALAGSAAAFAPTPVAQTSTTALNADFSKELGAQMPLGFWDPLGMMADADQDESTVFTGSSSSTAVVPG